ncbi:hypothetical protein BKA70DRAFT_1269690 [Coprinopsis sp. MPI-PUGE-AT-0042]|nr:hypothetical protein BKA70DRAFT_1269690 [Coprinopsis sp. MPI-PUGE-AT-0042]
MELHVNYWVLGTAVPSGINVARLAGEMRVADLRAFIGQEMELTEAEARKLKLFKVSLSQDELDAYDCVQPGWTYLSPVNILSKVLQELPDARVHVIAVKPPSTNRPASERRAISDLRDSRLVKMNPMSIARLSNYRDMQYTPSQRIFDDRPEADMNIAPLSLLYPPFGSFADVVMGRAPIPFDLYCSLVPAVDEFANAMEGRFPDDMARIHSARFFIDRIFKHKNVPSLTAGAIADTFPSDRHDQGPYKALLAMFDSPSLSSIPIVDTGVSDGHSMGPHGVPLAVLQVRNTVNSRGTNPEVQAVSCAAHIHARMSPPSSDLLDRWRIPCLGITVTGTYIRFNAILTLRHRYRIVSITPGYSFSPFATGGRDRKELYLAFAASCILLTQMISDITAALEKPPPLPSPTVDNPLNLPGISRLRHPEHRDKYVEFEIFEEGNPQLYCARVLGEENPREIVVKFVQRYCLELHRFCAERGHAPEIFGYEELPGGWIAIAMEYLEDSRPLNQPKFANSVMGLVREFHEAGYVHGDLRKYNILCTEDDWWLIDFDWAGLGGEAQYHTSALTEELLKGREGRKDLKITFDDDMRILQRTLDELAAGYTGT